MDGIRGLIMGDALDDGRTVVSGQGLQIRSGTLKPKRSTNTTHTHIYQVCEKTRGGGEEGCPSTTFTAANNYPPTTLKVL